MAEVNALGYNALRRPSPQASNPPGKQAPKAARFNQT
jgi:hypothetical protein